MVTYIGHSFLNTKLKFALQLQILEKLKDMPEISSDQHGSKGFVNLKGSVGRLKPLLTCPKSSLLNKPVITYFNYAKVFFFIIMQVNSTISFISFQVTRFPECLTFGLFFPCSTSTCHYISWCQ